MIDDLLKRKFIRDFLANFSEKNCKKLIPLALEFGIIHLKKKTNIVSLSVEEIESLVSSTKEKHEIKSKVEKEPSASGTHEHIKNTCDSTKTRSKSNIKEIRPSSKWRKGDSIVFKKKDSKKIKKDEETGSLNSDIYPKWWGSKVPKYQSSKEDQLLQNLDRRSTLQNESKTLPMEETKIEKEQPAKTKENREKKETNETKHKEYKKKISNEIVKKQEKPIKPELKVRQLFIKEVESKIKNDVERDKKLYNIQKQNTKSVVNKENEYTFPRKIDNNTDSNIKRILTSDYKIEYDKSLKPQAIREKSIERKVLSNNSEAKKSFQEERPDNRKDKISKHSYQEERTDYRKDNNTKQTYQDDRVDKKELLTKISNNINYTSDNENIM